MFLQTRNHSCYWTNSFCIDSIWVLWIYIKDSLEAISYNRIITIVSNPFCISAITHYTTIQIIIYSVYTKTLKSYHVPWILYTTKIYRRCAACRWRLWSFVYNIKPLFNLINYIKFRDLYTKTPKSYQGIYSKR